MSVKQPSFKLSSSSQAFTIIELLIVIVIIGILATITIVSYTGITSRANQAAIQSELSNASKTLFMYYAEYGTYPTNINTSTGCPISPNVDDEYCIKFSTGTKLIYNYKTSSTYELNFIKNSLTYEITGNSSPTVSPNWITIGNQTWSKYNLNIGTRIAGASSQTNNSTIEKYCYGNDEANCTNDNNGGLYQWDEAMQYSTIEGAQGICPAGSHIPTDTEWKILEMRLGMTQAQADLTDTWRGTDQGAQMKVNGDSELNIPLGGYYSGAFYGSAADTILWSSSESSTKAWDRILNINIAGLYRDTSDKTYGFSIRCLGN
ncbi:MAG: hypothetical protein PWQ10_402 [Patescibacteria group bacterium]|nr:hypothetical protein [Patescibacteria group bacterium]